MCDTTKPPVVGGNEWELLQIRSLLRLVAFAVEAERVLREVSAGAFADKAFEERLRLHVDAHAQWSMYMGEVPEVLEGIHQRLGAMLGVGE